MKSIDVVGAGNTIDMTSARKGGCAARTQRPVPDWYAGRLSPTVGTLGSEGERLGLTTAIGLTLPERINGSVSVTTVATSGTRPGSR